MNFQINDEEIDGSTRRLLRQVLAWSTRDVLLDLIAESSLCHPDREPRRCRVAAPPDNSHRSAGPLDLLRPPGIRRPFQHRLPASFIVDQRRPGLEAALQGPHELIRAVEGSIYFIQHRNSAGRLRRTHRRIHDKQATTLNGRPRWSRMTVGLRASRR